MRHRTAFMCSFAFALLSLTLQNAPAEPVNVRFDAPMKRDSGESASEFVLDTKGEFRFARD